MKPAKCTTPLVSSRYLGGNIGELIDDATDCLVTDECNTSSKRQRVNAFDAVPNANAFCYGNPERLDGEVVYHSKANALRSKR